MLRKSLIIFLLAAFCAQNLAPPARAQEFRVSDLPAPGRLVAPAAVASMPLTLKGLILHPENALNVDFLMDTGKSPLKAKDLNDKALTLMKYFLTALTMPEDDLWVNLSPYEGNKIIEQNLEKTAMGRDLLAEDYVLKQLTASLMYPEDMVGKKYWQEIYRKAAKELGTTQVPVNTFNKVWIVPSEAAVWEHNGKVIIVKSRLKVMLEEDYLALIQNTSHKNHTMASKAVREVILPVLEKEVNEGAHFIKLRQMYQAMILATWYKKTLKESILGKIYADRRKVKGIDDADRKDAQAIYQRYLAAFKKGAFNYVKEETDLPTGRVVARKYFSGGFSLKGTLAALTIMTGVLSLPQNAIARYAVSVDRGSVLVAASFNQFMLPPKKPAPPGQEMEAALQELEEIDKSYSNPSPYLKIEAAKSALRARDRDKAVRILQDFVDRNEKELGFMMQGRQKFVFRALEDLQPTWYERNYNDLRWWGAAAVYTAIAGVSVLSLIGIVIGLNWTRRWVLLRAGSSGRILRYALRSSHEEVMKELAKVNNPNTIDALVFLANTNYYKEAIERLRQLARGWPETRGDIIDKLFPLLGSPSFGIWAEVEKLMIELNAPREDMIKVYKRSLLSINEEIRSSASTKLSGYMSVEEIIAINLAILQSARGAAIASAESALDRLEVPYERRHQVYEEALRSENEDARANAAQQLRVHFNDRRPEIFRELLQARVRERLRERQPSDAMKSLMDHKGLAYAWAEQGKDFVVEYTKGEEVMDNSYDLGSRPTGVFIEERLEIKEGGPLPDSDMAMIGAGQSDLGGISLNSHLMDFQIRRDGNGEVLPVSPQQLKNIHIEGFFPAIISVKRVDLPALLEI